MRKILLASLSAAVLTSSAVMAADMPVKAPVYRAPVPIPYSWTGFYIGAQIGYGWGINRGQPANIGNLGMVPFENKPAGVLGGGHVGFNYQTGWLVLGIEGDFEAADMKDDGLFTSAQVQPGTFFPISSKADWLASIRGRAGVAVDRWLLYVTGGGAWVHLTTDYHSPFDNTVFDSISGTRTGWTVGGGVEYAFWENWRARIEYRHSDFQDKSILDPTHNFRDDRNQFHFDAVRLGVSYRFSG